jgi:hypothetical protein
MRPALDQVSQHAAQVVRHKRAIARAQRGIWQHLQPTGRVRGMSLGCSRQQVRRTLHLHIPAESMHAHCLWPTSAIASMHGGAHQICSFDLCAGLWASSHLQQSSRRAMRRRHTTSGRYAGLGCGFLRILPIVTSNRHNRCCAACLSACSHGAGSLYAVLAFSHLSFAHRQGFGQGGLVIELISTEPAGPRAAPMPQQAPLQQPPFQGLPVKRPPPEALGEDP